MFMEHSRGKEYKKIQVHPCNLSSVPNSGNIVVRVATHKFKFFVMGFIFSKFSLCHSSKDIYLVSRASSPYSCGSSEKRKKKEQKKLSKPK